MTMLLWSFTSAFAADETVLQDSVKKVTVRVTASEKRPALNFDSLITSNTKALEKNRIRHYSKASSYSNKKTAKLTAAKTKAVIAAKPAKKAPSAVITHADTEASVTTPGKSDEQVLKPVPVTDNEKTVAEPGNFKTSRAYLWVGFMLIVVGAILGILFGKTALLVSIAGMVFVIIGYTI